MLKKLAAAGLCAAMSVTALSGCGKKTANISSDNIEKGEIAYPIKTDVTLKYIDENGQEQVKRARGLLAKAFQHEVDHLNCKLFVDLVNPALKPELKKAIKKLRKDWN